MRHGTRSAQYAVSPESHNGTTVMPLLTTFRASRIPENLVQIGANPLSLNGTSTAEMSVPGDTFALHGQPDVLQREHH